MGVKLFLGDFFFPSLPLFIFGHVIDPGWCSFFIYISFFLYDTPFLPFFFLIAWLVWCGLVCWFRGFCCRSVCDCAWTLRKELTTSSCGNEDAASAAFRFCQCLHSCYLHTSPGEQPRRRCSRLRSYKSFFGLLIVASSDLKPLALFHFI